MFLKVRPFRRASLRDGKDHKLSAKFYGPFEVLARVGKRAFKLHLPEGSKVHPVFHISQLKKVVGNHEVTTEFPESIELPVLPMLEPEQILALRVIPLGEREVEQLLVK